MKLRQFISILILTVLVSFTAGAQDNPSVTVNKDNLGELIKTLESDTARTTFINNLKTLSEANGETAASPETPAVILSEAMGINAQTDQFLARYDTFLQSHNLNTTLIGRAGLTILSFLLAGAFLTLINKAITRLHSRLLRLKEKYHLTHNRYRLYTRLIRFSTTLTFLCLLIYTNAVIWGVSGFGIIHSDTAISILKNVMNVTVVSIFALGLWEAINIYIESTLQKNDTLSNNRMRTVIPVVRNIAVVIFGSLFGLVLLSEIGINIVPLLAGAGVIGIAIGFGAQTMVKNYIAGLTVILEDLMQVGDVVHVAGRRGVIERITIRKVQLRSADGNVHTIPFSEITVIENMTKDFSYYLMDISVAYREDTDEVIDILNKLSKELRADPNWQHEILDDIDIMGLDRFADSAIIIRARLRTVPGQQWHVGREFNRRMKLAFDKQNIEIPFPQQTIHFVTNKDGSMNGLPVSVKT